MISEDYVLAIMPRAGLGNKLLVWARAYVFAQLHQLPLYISPWEQLKIGPFLRGERDPRFYNSYFRHDHRLAFFTHYWFSYFRHTIINPSLTDTIRTSGIKQQVYLFRWNVADGDYFRELKQYREIVKRGIFEMLLPRHLHLVTETPAPCVGIHIRRGDFPELKPDEDFNTTSLSRTPLNYFEEMIHKIRFITQAPTPISLFSDARPEELESLLKIPNVVYASTNSAIADILTLSKSKTILLSVDSTFGYWAAFLSSAAVIHHPKKYRHSLRGDEVNKSVFEGAVPSSPSDWAKLLLDNLAELSHL